MNLTIERDAFKAALGRVKPAVLSGSNPALAGVLVTATGDGITLTATNIDTTITTTVVGQTNLTGQILAYHDPLERLVSTAPTGAVCLDMHDDYLHINAGRTKARLRVLDAGAFPQRAPLEKPEEAKLDEDWQAIQRVVAFRSTEVARPILAGIHLGGGVVEATDSFRLARHTVAVEAELLLSPDAITSAAKVCPDGVVTLRWQGQRYEIEAEGTVWAGHVIDGKFPSVENLIPSDPTLAVTVNRNDLLTALRSVASIGDDKHTGTDGKTSRTSVVRFLQTPDDSEGLTLQRVVQDTGDVEVTLQADATGEQVYGFSAPLLVPILAALQNDEVTLHGVDNLKPWVVREGGFLGLIMPVRL